MKYTAVTLTLLGGVAVAAHAQERERDRERERVSVFSFGPETFPFNLRRGRMGINVDLRPDAVRDSIGARVAGLTPGGAAERAGVQTGDLITRVNGTRLVVAESGDRDQDWEDEQSRPALRLLRIASRLDPGDTVRLDVRRGTQNQTFTFVAEESDMDRIVERVRVPMGRDFVERTPEGGLMRFMMSGGGPTDLELVRVNPGLGEYFGTTEGLLVVDVGADTALGLRAGDVILAISGRRPTSPAHAMRILSTYEGGEAVQFELMRQRRRSNVSGRMPQRDLRWRIQRNSFELRVPHLELQPLMERMQQLEHELPRMRMRLHEPEIRMRQHTPEIRIEEQQSLMKTDGWS